MVILILAAVVLLVLSFSEKQPKNTQWKADSRQAKKEEKTDDAQSYIKEQERRFSAAIKDVEGVGEAEVLITFKASAETVVNKDASSSYETETGADAQQTGQQQEETVILQDAEGNETPVIVKKLPPEIAGIVVICEGGDRQEVINEITNAAQVLFSVSAHKVKVMKKLDTTKTGR